MATPRAAEHGPFAPLSIWLSISVVLATASVAYAQSSDETLAALRERGEREGWTFTVAASEVTERLLSELCGLVIPDQWWVDAPFDDSRPLWGSPTAFDWRTQTGCPPVRDQGSCGSCWAFGTVGALECNILIRDGDLVDLSEQWLVSCNRDGYGCAGGWWAHEYHRSKTDLCGDTGAVLEADCPYVARDTNCMCHYPHHYHIDGWAYVGGSYAIPSVEAIKQAILTYGPVSTSIYVDDAFAYYSGGIFNACSDGTPNHAVVLVGWDDNSGNGYWILRNSWGPYWGEQGYMRIRYGCSNVGYATCYIEYAGTSGPRIDVQPTTFDFGNVTVGQSLTQAFTVKNVGGGTLTGSVSGAASPFSFDGSTSYSLSAGATQAITLRYAPLYQGDASATLTFTGGGGQAVAVTGTGVGNGPADVCANAPYIGDGTYTGDNTSAGTDGAASCGGGGTGDVWWRYVAARTGVLTVDTCGSDFDTVLSVYSTCSGVELACNDDYAGCPANSHASRITLPVTAGATRYIRVAGVALQRGNIVLNVETTTPPRTISGHVLTADGTPVPGVTLIGLPDDPVTDADGAYVATVDYAFSGTATPQKTAYNFAPTSRAFTNVTTDLTNQDFTATPPSFRIGGRIIDQYGNAVRSVRLTGLPGTPVTGTNGTYQATVPLGFSATVTPSKTGCTFSPAFRTYSNVTNDLPLEDYLAQQQTGSLQVILEPEAVRTAGAQWQVDGGAWHVSGDTALHVAIGTHTVVYSTIPGWTAPLADTVTIVNEQTTYLTTTYGQQTHVLVLSIDPTYGGTTVADPLPDRDGRYTQDTVVHLTAQPASGFAVAFWTGVDTGSLTTSPTQTVTMTGDRSVAVRFEVQAFQMFQFSARASTVGGSVAPTRGVYREGTVVSLTATANSGYRIKAWTGTDNDASLDAVNSVTMNAHKSITVAFEQWLDCNHNGVPDDTDIANGTSLDCDANGIPDECEVDTDGDGIIDACDDTPNGETTLSTQTPAVRPTLCGAGTLGSTLGLTLLLLATRPIAAARPPCKSRRPRRRS